MKFIIKHPILFVILLGCSVFIYNNFTRSIEGNELVDISDSAYINNLYMSDEFIYNNYLSNDEKKTYDLIIEAVSKRNSEVLINQSSYECSNYDACSAILFNVVYGIVCDHPELLTFSNVSLKYENNNYTFSISYAVPLDFLADISIYKIERIIDNIKKDTINMSDTEKVKYVYEWFGKNTKYDKMFMYNSKNQSIFNVFINKNAVCAGFAKAAQIIFQNIGIKSYGVVGNTTGGHMWNIIELDGKWYNFDATVASSSHDLNDSWFYNGLIQSKMNDHKFDHLNYYPELSQEEFFLK